MSQTWTMTGSLPRTIWQVGFIGHVQSATVNHRWLGPGNLELYLYCSIPFIPYLLMDTRLCLC